MGSRRGQYKHDADGYDYPIETFADFQELQSRVNSGTEGRSVRFPGAANGDGFFGKVFKMLNDVDFANHTWTGIGTYTSSSSYRPFRGTLNGGGFSIVNYNTATQIYSGLFLAIENASIHDLAIEFGERVFVTGTRYFSILAHLAKGNCTVRNFRSSYLLTGSVASGIVNSNDGVLVFENIIIGGEITANSTSQNATSALMYINNAGSATFKNCAVFTSITLSNASTVNMIISGGLGRNNNGTVSFENCYFAGRLSINGGSATYRTAGGLLSYSTNSNVSFKNCYVIGQTTSTPGGFGLVSAVTPSSSENVYCLDSLTPGTLFNGDPKTEPELIAIQ
jgi:hypothetical protein